MFTDMIGDYDRKVLGVLVYLDDVHQLQCAPLAVVRWSHSWLPYFEDEAGWVYTGWDATGRVSRQFKPFGWGCTEFFGDTSPGSLSSHCGESPDPDASEIQVVVVSRQAMDV